MFPFFQPDFLFETPRQIPTALFSALGIRLLFCDIDNTLVTYDDPEPTAGALAFLEGLRAVGVEVVFLSNNTRERVERFNRSLGFTALQDAGKPLCRSAMKRVMREKGCSEGSTAVLGDQILTDVLAARFTGLPVLLVRPIRDKSTLFFRMKRLFEKPFLRRFCRKWGSNSERKLASLLQAAKTDAWMPGGGESCDRADGYQNTGS